MSRSTKAIDQYKYCPFHAKVSASNKRVYTRQVKRHLKHLIRGGVEVLPPYKPEWKTQNFQW